MVKNSLCVCPNLDMAVGANPCGLGLRFNVTLMHDGRLKLALYDNFRLCERFIDIAAAQFHVKGHIAGLLRFPSNRIRI